MALPNVIFWDVDTQVDFLHPSGALHVPGAQIIVANLERLTQHAIQRLSSGPTGASWELAMAFTGQISTRT